MNPDDRTRPGAQPRSAASTTRRGAFWIVLFWLALGFALYAGFRIFGEHFREPDAAMVGAFSKGQFFSFFMFAFAAAFFVHAWRGWKRRAG